MNPIHQQEGRKGSYEQCLMEDISFVLKDTSIRLNEVCDVLRQGCRQLLEHRQTLLEDIVSVAGQGQVKHSSSVSSYGS